ncbi:MAG: hypothetical protein HY900_01685 [Deltaproteobacteria bacterium]|nr:hypothetical protein [Deltaproteobacteria bacterium]
MRDLIRKDQIGQAEQRLAALMLEGLESGSPIPADEGYWREKRDALLKKHSGK